MALVIFYRGKEVLEHLDNVRFTKYSTDARFGLQTLNFWYEFLITGNVGQAIDIAISLLPCEVSQIEAEVNALSYVRDLSPVPTGGRSVYGGPEV